MVPFVKEIEVAPAVGANVGEPHPLVVAAGVEATCICAGEVGNVSENWTLERTLFRLGLVIVNVRVEVPPARIGLDENSFEMLGGFKTVRDALATPVDPVFVPPSVDEMNSLILL